VNPDLVLISIAVASLVVGNYSILGD